LPVVMGVGFTGIAPIIAIGTNPELGIQWVYGAVLGSGLFTVLAAPYMSRLVRWFPSVVTGTVVLIIGISLMRVGINWAAGGQPMISSPTGPIPNPDYGLPSHLIIAGLVLGVVLLVAAFAKGFISHLSVLVGLIVGFLVALALGNVSFSGVGDASWFAVITPFHFGLPRFDAFAIATLCIVMIVMMVESTGVFLAIGEITNRKIASDDIARGLRADGVGNLISGTFNSFTFITYTQNVGLVQITGVYSRWVVATAGLILVVLGCLPKVAHVAAAIPAYVLGGAAVVMFGMVAAAGIKILARVDFVSNSRNLYIVAVSVAVSMIPIVAGRFYSQLPDVVERFMNNGILVGAFTAILLNMLFNHNTREEEEVFTYADEPKSVRKEELLKQGG